MTPPPSDEPSAAPTPPSAPVRVRYRTIEVGPHDIHLRMLWDRNQYNDPYGEAERVGISDSFWPLFGMLWDASQILAHHVLTLDVEGRDILEVGCGLGLPSLVLNARGANITAMDRHPEARHFLAHNAALNGGPPIPFVRIGYTEDDPLLGTYDTLIASDLLYEPEHVEQVADFVDRHLRAGGEVYLADAGRGHENRFRRVMEGRGFEAWVVEDPVVPDGLKEPWSGKILGFRKP